MPAKWQTVRVFISSTFSDMHAERDLLVKRVFPSLREKLAKYRIHLVDIDLRWGVTKEQADDDHHHLAPPPHDLLAQSCKQIVTEGLPRRRQDNKTHEHGSADV